MGIRKNSSLPSWLKCHLKNGVLELAGTPG